MQRTASGRRLAGGAPREPEVNLGWGSGESFCPAGKTSAPATQHELLYFQLKAAATRGLENSARYV